MKRSAKKQRRAGAVLPPARGPFELGNVPPAGTMHRRGSSRRGSGRLGRALRAVVSNSPVPVDKQQAAAKALARWENEGDRPAPRTKLAQGKQIEAARKELEAKHSPKKAKAKPTKSVTNDRR